jgi:tRNA 5-methylaminomethyl-2-thiouridine biosynthesis bifunctional protein
MTSRQRAAQAAWARHAGQAGDSNQPVSLRPAAWGARLSCRDHLPLIGALPDPAQLSRARESLMRNDRLPVPRLPGLWMASAFGGRGLLWSVLAAEVLAAHLEVEPMPLTHDLMAAIDPARFVRRALRRTKSM